MRRSGPRRPAACRCRLSYVLLIILTGPAAWATDDWIGHDITIRPPVHTYDGSFSDAVNWSTRTVPGAADVAQFSAGQSYTITFTSSPTNAGLNISAGTVTFASSLNPTYMVGSAGISSQLTLNGVNLLAKGSLAVDGDGSLTVDAGTQLSSGDLSIGASRSPLSSQSSTFTVSGAGARVSQLGAAGLTIGTSNPLPSAGLLHVDNGGTFTTGSGAIEVSPFGTINLTGGTFTAQGNLTVDGGLLAADSASSFNLASGQTLTVQNGGRIDLNSSSDLLLRGATVVVDGAASHFNTASNVYVGSDGQASTATWQNNAIGSLGGLVVGGTSTPNTNGTIVIQSGASVTSLVTAVGATNQTGQSGAVFIFGGGVLRGGQLSLGAAVSSGTINLNGGTLITPDAAALGPMGKINLNAGGTLDVHANLTINGGSLQGTGGTLQLNPGSSLTVANGATVHTAGTTWSIHGSPITVDSSQLTVDTPIFLGADNNDSLTLNNANVTLGDLHLADGQVAGTAVVQANGGALFTGTLFIGTGGLSGQTATFTLRAGCVAYGVRLGAAANSAGTLNVEGANFRCLHGTTVNATGLLNLASGASWDEPTGLTVSGGSVRSDAGSTLQLGSIPFEGSITIQNGGAADLNGPVFTLGGPILVDGSASHFNTGMPLTIRGPITFQNSAAGALSGGLILSYIQGSPAMATIASGAQVTAASVTLAYDPNTGVGTQMLVTGGNSSVTMPAGGTLSVQRGSMLSVQSGGTFVTDSTATVDAGGMVQIQGGTFRANADMAISGTIQQDAAGTFILASGRTLTIHNGAAANVSGSFTGGHVINDGSFMINGGNTLIESLDGTGTTKVAAGARITADYFRQHALTLTGAAAAPPQPVANLAVTSSSVDALTITSAGQLDLSNNRLQINYTAGQSPILAIRAALASGYHGGAWDGPGIVSTSAGAKYALGYADFADGIVAGLPPNAVVVEFAIPGDANLDGTVGFTDLVLLASHYGMQSGANWDEGDFNYDGKVGFNDLVALAANYNLRLSAATVGQFTSALAPADGPGAAVPEASTGLIVVSAGTLLTLRRRRMRRLQIAK